ncbi:hypothetical protein ADUPG1_004209, partial [Aduncisulcus paluster]
VVHPDFVVIMRTCIESIIHFQGEPLTTKRGVAQGNGLSPILFNILLDIVIPTQMKRNLRAFADDIIGIAKNSSEAEELLCDLCDSLKLGGLLVHETKCFSIGSHEITIGNTALVRADPS